MSYFSCGWSWGTAFLPVVEKLNSLLYDIAIK